MILHVSKRSFSNEVEHIGFPADAAKVRCAVIGLEEFGGWAPAYIIGGEGPAQVLAGYINRGDLFSEGGTTQMKRDYDHSYLTCLYSKKRKNAPWKVTRS